MNKDMYSRRKSCPFSGKGNVEIDYKDVALLMKYISPDRGKIIPSRISGVSRKFQRKLAKSIKNARRLALLPYIP